MEELRLKEDLELAKVERSFPPAKKFLYGVLCLLDIRSLLILSVVGSKGCHFTGIALAFFKVGENAKSIVCATDRTCLTPKILNP